MLTRDDGRYATIITGGFLLYAFIIFSIQSYFIINPNYFHEEHRLLFPYYQAITPNLFSGDYIASFVGAFSQPYLYEGVTRLWLWAGGELTVWHRVLPLGAWLAFLAGVAVAARRLGNRITMLGAVGIVVAQPVYLYQITSALPHAFAFPLLIWAIVALLYGSARGLALIVLSSGLLYPAITPLVGLLLAWHVFVTQRTLGRPNADRLKALLLVGMTGAASVWLLLDAMSGPEGFGAALQPNQRVEIYPENGPEGRHFYGVFNPLTYVMAKAMLQFREGNVSLTIFILLTYGIVGLYGFLSLRRGSGPRRALFAFVVCGLTVGLAVLAVKPFHVYRFVLYPAFTVLPLLFTIGVQQSCRRLAQRVRFPNAIAIGVLALFVVAVDSFDHKKMGYAWHLDPETRRVFAFAADLPPETLFAAWPGFENALELLPYVARRPLFVMRKAHYPTYETHILAMRERTHALIDAYLATDETPLRTLHCRWGVDYLIVSKAHFAQDDTRPRYFAPFDRRIAEIWRRHRREDFVLRKPRAQSVVLETESYTILRLRPTGGEKSGQGTSHCE